MAAPTSPRSGEPLLPPHGGYRSLKSFQLAQLIYDITVRFCGLYLERRSRTVDQMTPPARSGVQNIAEGSVASGTSKKTELKLTNVARASLEALRGWVEEERGRAKKNGLPRTGTDEHGQVVDSAKSVSVGDSPRPSVSGSLPPPSSVFVANAALSLLNLCCHLLDRQLAAQAEAFEQEGGFTERLYRVRSDRRKR